MMMLSVLSCDSCQFHCRTQEEFSVHQAENHLWSRIYQCRNCGKKCASKDGMVEHIIEEHNSQRADTIKNRRMRMRQQQQNNVPKQEGQPDPLLGDKDKDKPQEEDDDDDVIADHDPSGMDANHQDELEISSSSKQVAATLTLPPRNGHGVTASSSSKTTTALPASSSSALSRPDPKRTAGSQNPRSSSLGEKMPRAAVTPSSRSYIIHRQEEDDDVIFLKQVKLCLPKIELSRVKLEPPTTMSDPPLPLDEDDGRRTSGRTERKAYTDDWNDEDDADAAPKTTKRQRRPRGTTAGRRRPRGTPGPRKPCPLCDISLANSVTLVNHLREVHTHPEYRPHKCPHCPHSSKRSGDLNVHIRNVHKEFK